MGYALEALENSEGELREVAELLRVVFPRSPQLHQVAYLRWLYVENPRGPAIGTNARQGGTLAAHYAVVPIEVRLDGRRSPAVLSLNTAVHPAHRGSGLFGSIGDETYESCRRSGYHHVIGVTNFVSTPRFEARHRFQVLGPLDAWILWRPLRLVPAPSAAPSWERVWTEQELRWRVRNPVVAYRLERRRGQRAILAPTAVPGIRAVLLAEPEAAEVDLADSAPPRTRAPGLRLWLGRSPRVQRRRCGGRSIPVRLRPSPLNLVFRPLQDPADRLDGARVDFSAIDFDAY